MDRALDNMHGERWRDGEASSGAGSMPGGSVTGGAE